MTELYTYNFTAGRGVTFRQVVLLTDAADHPLNTTGWTARMQLISKRDGSLVADLITASGEALLDNAGRLTLSMTALKTATLPEGVYDHVVYVSSSPAEVKEIISGTFAVEKGVLQPVTL